ncbi:protein TIC 40, chloroplastic-like [Aristolochia californica]|uniref:protein TIC 40, chloroplastic-like n=1 Tax=Aristolochia californica TaxID=171875 RepID=UPI0035D8150E
MENLALVSPTVLIGGSVSISGIPVRRTLALPRISRGRPRQVRSRNVVSEMIGDRAPRKTLGIALKDFKAFASISSSSSQETSAVAVNPQPSLPPSSTSFGSPLFWIGVGVAFSALFSWAASSLKKYAMQQAFKTLMGQMPSSQNAQFNPPAFSPGSSFPFPPPPTSASGSSSVSTVASQPEVTVDVTPTMVETAPVSEVKAGVKEAETKEEVKKYAFVDVTPEETMQQDPFGYSNMSNVGSPQDFHSAENVTTNGAATIQGDYASTKSTEATGTSSPNLSVEALEKMMEDPTVQKMVYPYLPEEMRNPSTFKWMLQNPQYRQQLQDMLNNMGGSTEWDNRVMDSLKNFDLSSPEVKQQFDQIGLTPEEVISKIMANPEVAMAFQNPKVQAAIMDCSQNPLSIAKYQNDKEVMDVFNKISELFPGVTGSP